MLLSAALICTVFPPGLSAGDVFIPSISGRVFVDGRPINRIVQIQLEAHNSAIAATAFTLDPPRFTFRNVTLDLSDTYFLVIREVGFQELKYQLHGENFVRDSSQESVAHFTGILVLNLEKLPPDNSDAAKSKRGSQTVGVKQLQAKIPEEARKEFNAALKNLAGGNGELGLNQLEKAVELAPNYYDALNKLGVELLRSEQPSRAEVFLLRARDLNPYDPVPLTNLGILYMQQADDQVSAAGQSGVNKVAEPLYQKAADVFEKALEIIPLNPLANFHLGSALYKTGNNERAESLLLLSIRLDGKLLEARATLVYLYYRQRRYAEALDQITAYLEASPSPAERVRIETVRKQIQGVMRKE
jgi:Flp pilus assembly protein TadD